MYTIHMMNLNINIRTLNFLYKYENYYFNFLKTILGFQIWYLNMKIFISIV
jgi:hypothetical protein